MCVGDVSRKIRDSRITRTLNADPKSGSNDGSSYYSVDYPDHRRLVVVSGENRRSQDRLNS